MKKVKDHCHFTGKYRGAAHNKCNLRCRNDHCKLDVFFHNGKNYDFHFLMQSLSEVGKDIIKFDVKPNSEKQLSFSMKAPAPWEGTSYNLQLQLRLTAWT